MPTIELKTAISLLLSLTIGLVLFKWIFYTYKDDTKSEGASENTTQCPYCTYVFNILQTKDIYTCPNCKSLISLKERNENTNE